MVCWLVETIWRVYVSHMLLSEVFLARFVMMEVSKPNQVVYPAQVEIKSPADARKKWPRRVCACVCARAATPTVMGNRRTGSVPTVRLALTFTLRAESVGRSVGPPAGDGDPCPGPLRRPAPSLPGRCSSVIRTDGSGRVELTGYSRRANASSLRMRRDALFLLAVPSSSRRPSLSTARGTPPSTIDATQSH